MPHIGHAYTTIACDAMARFARLDGRQTYFLTGTDEHGQKVQQVAKERGVEPQAFTDELSERFRDLVAHMGITNDDFIRTTEERHRLAVQDLWRKLTDAGDIYLGGYAGWYAVRDEAFYTESELVDGKAPTGAPVEWVEEPSYFFRLSAWQDRLLDYYEKNPDFIAPASRRNEVISFVKGGLQDLSISRTSFSWGIPVPDDADHVMYVWLDALTNYMTALGYPGRGLRRVRKILARGDSHHRQGHPPLSRRLLAGLPSGRRPQAAEARLRPWLVDDRGRENVEIARQRARSLRVDRELRP